MRNRSLPMALLTAAAILGAGAAGIAQPAAPQQFAQAKPQHVLELRARNSAEIMRSFGFAARQPGAQAIEITCAPGSSDHCTGDFVAACNKNDGGMSTNPDGSVTCSLPQHD
ncbi:MAG: hypothetical protein ACFCUT_03985 [Kiloniellaceae bacterium]